MRAGKRQSRKFRQWLIETRHACRRIWPAPDSRRARKRKDRSGNSGSVPRRALHEPPHRRRSSSAPTRTSAAPIAPNSPSALIAGSSRSVCSTSRSRAAPMAAAQPAHFRFDRLDALAANAHRIDPQNRAQPPQRDAALMHPFRMKIESRAVVVRGQVCETISDDRLERIARRHLGGEVELGALSTSARARRRPTHSRGRTSCAYAAGHQRSH